MRIKTLPLFLVIVTIVGGLANLFSPERALHAKANAYNAVLLDNNSVYFGKVADLGTD